MSFFLEGFLFLFFFLASERSVVDVAVFFLLLFPPWNCTPCAFFLLDR